MQGKLISEKKIQLMICGAQKAGTTSLLNYLNEHPEIVKQKVKEFSYFILDEVYNKGYADAFDQYFEPKGKIVLAKNVGIMYNEKAIKRLQEHNPNIIIILLLRNPVTRAYSNYFYALRKGDEHLPEFEKALDAEKERLQQDNIKWRNCAYIERGIYSQSIEMLYKYFTKEQVRIYLFEDFKMNPQMITADILNLFGLSIQDTSVFETTHNENAIAKSSFAAKMINKPGRLKKLTKRLIPVSLRKNLKVTLSNFNEKELSKPKMKEETKKKLQDFYKPYNQKLSELIGIDLTIWEQ